MHRRLCTVLLATTVALISACAPPPYTRGLASVGPDNVREQLGEVRYVSGLATMDAQYPGQHPTGLLVVTDTALVLLDPMQSGQWLTIPLRTIDTTGASVENAGPSKTARVMFGLLATGSHDELVAVHRTLPTTVEVVVFRATKKGAAPGIAAKIAYHARRAREAAGTPAP